MATQFEGWAAQTANFIFVLDTRFQGALRRFSLIYYNLTEHGYFQECKRDNLISSGCRALPAAPDVKGLNYIVMV